MVSFIYSYFISTARVANLQLGISFFFTINAFFNFTLFHLVNYIVLNYVALSTTPLEVVIKILWFVYKHSSSIIMGFLRYKVYIDPEYDYTVIFNKLYIY